MPRWLAVCLPLCLLSCDSKSPPTATPSESASEAAATPSEPSTAPGAQSKPKWADMTREQKEAHMDQVVLPAMAAKFRGWNAERYEDFGCATCHGAGVEDGKFDMPNPDLPKLGDWDAMEKAQPDVVKFMVEVEVEMAALLDTPAYDPKTHEGFGCHNCHTSE